MRSRCHKVAILLSTYQGERFLQQQLDSLLAQTHTAWTVFWRDDGSTDQTIAIMEAFTARLDPGRCQRVPDPDIRLGAAKSYLLLLARAVAAGAEDIAYADQDDVWLPEKLARGHAALAEVPGAEPALYCARQILVDSSLQRIGLSPPLHRPAEFPAALTQNIAVGCTVMLNRAAASLVAASDAPGVTLHDWWSYLLVSAAGGHLLIDDTPVLLYRQHAANLVGSPLGGRRRAIAAIRRGPGAFMNLLRAHVAALLANRGMLTPDARRDIARINAALHGRRRDKWRVLNMPNLRRQTSLETWLFRFWFLLG